MKRIVNRPHKDVISTLSSVICVREVSIHWHYHTSYIYQLVREGKLSCVKSGNNVILDLGEVVQLLGMPKIPLTYRVLLRD